MSNRTTPPVRPAPDRPSPAHPEGEGPRPAAHGASPGRRAAPAGDARGPAGPRRPVTIWLPDGPQTVGRAPEVDREWLPESPRPRQPGPRPADKAPLAAALVVLAVLAISLLSGLGPLEAAAAGLAAGAVALVVAERAGGRREPEDALRRARDALLFGEDARGVLGRLRTVEAAGRAGRCLGITRRCLEEAGRHGHLQEVLRWEAVRWIGRTLDALSQDVK